MLDRRALAEPSPYRMRTVQEADGPVRWAFLENGPLSTAWVYYNSTNATGTRQGRTVFQIVQSGEEYDQAVVGGSIDDLAPSVLDYRHISAVGHHVTAGGGLWAMHQVGVFFTAPWDGSAAVDVSNAFTNQQGFPFIHDDFAVWNDGDWPTTGRHVAYTPALGAYPFIDYGPGFHDVAGFGTDGVDMVWVHSHDKQASQDPWGQRDIMTAPFTKDPAQIVERRLRSYPLQGSLVSQFAVGCGHAAVRVKTGMVLVVRIADGYWWELPAGNCIDGMPMPGSWCYDLPIALTCDELFVHSWPWNGNLYIRSLARIQLSSLGTPSPPD